MTNEPVSSDAEREEPLVDDPAAEQTFEGLRDEIRDLQDRLLRSQAEFENFRKRSRRELEEERRYAVTPLVLELLPVVDNVDRAIEAAEKSSESSSLLEGVRMIALQLTEVLKRHGCEPIDPAGAEFDPNLHEAIAQQPSETQPPGTVLHVAQRGYRLNDRVIRPAQVVVAAAR